MQKICNLLVYPTGYSDIADIKNIIDANIDSPIRFDFDCVEIQNKNISVLHFPPSTDKPHYILRYKNGKNQVYENEVFIRSGSAKSVAGKSDIDRMYIERRNIIVERRLEVSINISMLRIRKSENNSGYFIDHPITIENLGARVAVISRIEMESLFGNLEAGGQNIIFYSTDFAYKNLVIESGQLFNSRVVFNTLFNDDEFYRHLKQSHEHTDTHMDPAFQDCFC